MKRKMKTIPKIIIIFFVSVVSFLPFYYTIVMATHSTDQVMRGLEFVPGGYLLDNLKTVLNAEYFVAFRNSILVSVVSTILTMLVSAAAGYGMTAYQFKGQKLIYNFVLFTMMVPSTLGMIGYMQEMRLLNLGGSLWALILIWIPNGFGVFWMTQYLKSSLQIELIESARLDGCGEIRIFFNIVMPCIKPAIITLCLLIFLWSWNSYLLPLVMVNKAENYTIPLFIQTLGNEHKVDIAAQITGLLIAVIPLILAFAIFSKDFIRGLTEGAVKG